MSYKYALTAITCPLMKSRTIIEFTEFSTEIVIRAKCSGGESNVFGITRHWDNPNGFDTSIIFDTREVTGKIFASMVSEYPYAGCKSKDLAKYLRDELQKVYDAQLDRMTGGDK